MEVTPQGNYVLCKAVPIKLPGGIILASDTNRDDKKPKPCHFEVIAVGPGKLLDTGERAAIRLNPGDRLVIHRLAFQAGRVMFLEPSLFDGQELALVDAGDVIGVETGDVVLTPKIATAKRIPALVH